MKTDNDFLTISIKSKADCPGYLTTGRKTEKVFAIESARWFAKIPEMEKLRLSIDDQELMIDRSQIEDYYGADLSAMFDENGIPNDTWRKEFLRKWDNPSERSAFVERFVKPIS